MEPHKENNSKENKTQEPVRYGLKEIFNLVYTGNSYISKLALGTDLTSLGLDVIAPEALHSSMTTLLQDVQPPKEYVEFNLPACYYMNTPTLKLSHLKRFTVETLFYIFYTIVCDIWQEFAAMELYNRGWAYHTNWKKWFFYNEQTEGDNVEAMWTYFEPSTWSKRHCNIEIDPNDFLKSETLRSLLNDQSAVLLLSENSMDSLQQSAFNDPDLNGDKHVRENFPGVDPFTQTSNNSNFANQDLRALLNEASYSDYADKLHCRSTNFSSTDKDNFSQPYMYENNINFNASGRSDKLHKNSVSNLMDSCKTSTFSNGQSNQANPYTQNQVSNISMLSMHSSLGGFNCNGSAASPLPINARSFNKQAAFSKSLSNLDFFNKQSLPFSSTSQADTYQQLLKSLNQHHNHHQQSQPQQQFDLKKKVVNSIPTNLSMNAGTYSKQAQNLQHYNLPYLNLRHNSKPASYLE